MDSFTCFFRITPNFQSAEFTTPTFLHSGDIRVTFYSAVTEHSVITLSPLDIKNTSRYIRAFSVLVFMSIGTGVWRLLMM